MASTRRTNLITDYSCDGKKQRTDTPTLPSPEQTDYSDTDTASSFASASASVSASASESYADRETINEAFQTIKNIFYGLLPAEPYLIFHFETPSSFQSLRNKLENSAFAGLFEFFEQKLRFDWNADTGDLLLRLMGCFLHDTFMEGVKKMLQAELNRIAENPELKETCETIISGGTSMIKIHDGLEKSPDGQMGTIDSRTPSLITEVAYSEHGTHVLNKTNEYFHGLYNCTVLAFDIRYAPPPVRGVENYAHRGTVSLSTSEQWDDNDGNAHLSIHKLVVAEVFRSPGQAIEGKVEIPFPCLVPFEKRKDLPMAAYDPIVCLSFADLADLLSQCEQGQRIRETPPILKRLLTVTVHENGRVHEMSGEEFKRTIKRQKISHTPEAPPRRSPQLQPASTPSASTQPASTPSASTQSSSHTSGTLVRRSPQLQPAGAQPAGAPSASAPSASTPSASTPSAST
ncbi:hypothetical protein F4859DRAFT_347199 [Xylaria cf. heliscus]|nr:hypothetical protein F4859DRAFT_347199 [Xylaria cf. heliscus]